MIKLTIDKTSFDFIQNQFMGAFSKKAFGKAVIEDFQESYNLIYDEKENFYDDDADIAALFATVGMSSNQMEVNELGRKIEKIQDEYLLNKQEI